MQRRKPLLVTLDITQPSIIELTTDEHVQLDRLVATSRGALAERQGQLLPPGTTRVSLDAGQFCFKALSDAQLRVVQGGVTRRILGDSKEPWPQPPPFAPNVAGDDPDGEVPCFTVTEA
jgi:hypothetical protein